MKLTFCAGARGSSFVRLVGSLALAAPLGALLACSGESADDADGPRFQPSTATPAAQASGAVPGAAGTSSSPGTPTAVAPGGSGSELPPPTSLNPGAAGAGGNSGGTPAAAGAGGAAVPDPGLPAVGSASAGCALAQAAPASPFALDTHQVFFPPGYDGSTPLPLVFAFHGANRDNVEMRTVDSRTAGGVLEMNYVVAYMKSAGDAWDLGTDYPRFSAALDAIAAQFCIATDNVFAFGHSSGAQFISQMLGSSRETRFAGVVPVSSSRFGNPAWSPVPTFVIHGLNDTARPQDLDGADDILQYTESNQCSGDRQPLNVPACDSIANTGPVDAGCFQYAGCAAPVLFCNHNDPNYIDESGNPTNHGWPCFANSQIFEFFESLR